MLAEIISTVGTSITGIGTWFVNAFSALTSIFWQTSSTGGSLTIVGELSLIAVCVAIVARVLRTLFGLARA